MMGDSSHRIFAKSIIQHFKVSMPLTFKLLSCDRIGIKTLMNTWLSDDFYESFGGDDAAIALGHLDVDLVFQLLDHRLLLFGL